MDPSRYRVLIRGGGELASATAHHLFHSGFKKILILERKFPKAVRRSVCFSEAILDNSATVDGVTAVHVRSLERIQPTIDEGRIAITAINMEAIVDFWHPDIFIEATMLRRNWGLTKAVAPVVVALGPGYIAGKDCHAVVDTVRGPMVGSVHEDTGENLENHPPAEIMGFTGERSLKAVRDGVFFTQKKIGDEVERGERVGTVVSVFGVEDYRRGVPIDATYAVTARIGGVIRGLLRDGVPVKAGDRIGDVDPRGFTDDLDHVSDKSKRVAEGVHEALLDMIHLLPKG